MWLVTPQPAPVVSIPPTTSHTSAAPHSTATSPQETLHGIDPLTTAAAALLKQTESRRGNGAQQSSSHARVSANPKRGVTAGQEEGPVIVTRLLDMANSPASIAARTAGTKRGRAECNADHAQATTEAETEELQLSGVSDEHPLGTSKSWVPAVQPGPGSSPAAPCLTTEASLVRLFVACVSVTQRQDI